MRYFGKENRIRTMLGLAVLLVCCMAFLSGCGRVDTEVENPDVVLTFNGEDITLGEVYVYANTIIENYEKTYGDSIWQLSVPVSETDSENMEELTRRDIISCIVRVKVLVQKAADYEVSLSDEEKDSLRRQGDAFFKNLTDQQIADMQLTKEISEKVFIENELAKKTYDEIMDRAGIEVSDEDARQTTYYDLSFECYITDSAGNVTEMSRDEKDAQYERALQAYNTLLNPVAGDSTNIEGLAEFYGLSSSGYHTQSPEEIRKTYGDSIADMIYSLEDGSYSLVTESEYGYHIFYIKALTDRDATNALKESQLSKKQQQYFGGFYGGWLKELDKDYSYEKSVDQMVYHMIEF